MGEGRGKLEALIAELESKQAEIQRILKEYEVLLPHLQSGLEALDQAGFTDSTPVEIPKPAAGPQPVPEKPKQEAAAKPEPEPEKAAEASKDDKKKTSKKKKAAEPARRSIASLVGDDPGESQEAMSASGDDVH